MLGFGRVSDAVLEVHAIAAAAAAWSAVAHSIDARRAQQHSFRQKSEVLSILDKGCYIEFTQRLQIAMDGFGRHSVHEPLPSLPKMMP